MFVLILFFFLTSIVDPGFFGSSTFFSNILINFSVFTLMVEFLEFHIFSI